MKAEITKYDLGLSGEDHTHYRLQLVPENKEEMLIAFELNDNYVVWVSPNIREGDGTISWWGKK